MLPLGQIVKQARKEKGLTQSELADNVISRSMLSLIENGLSYPSMSTLEHIAERLEKPITYFLSVQSMLDEKCSLLISEIETLYEREEYAYIIEKTNDFLNNYLGNNISSLKDKHIGMLYLFLGLSYFNLRDKKDKKAHHYLNLAAEHLCKVKKAKVGLSKAYTYLGRLAHLEKDYKKMEYYMELASSTLGDITSENKHHKIKNIYHLSLSYYHQHRYDEAIIQLNRVFDYSKKYDFLANFGDFCMLLALCYRNTGNFDKSKDFNYKAIMYFKLIENDYMAHRYYINMAMNYRFLNDYENSLKYIDDAITFFEKINDSTKYINANVEKIKTLFVSNTDEEIITNLVAEIRDHLNNDPISKGELLCILGHIELKNDNYEEAMSLLQEAENLLSKSEDSEMKVYLYYGLNKIYEHYKNLESAYTYLQKVNDLISIKTYYRNLINNL